MSDFEFFLKIFFGFLKFEHFQVMLYRLSQFIFRSFERKLYLIAIMCFSVSIGRQNFTYEIFYESFDFA